VVVQHYSCLWRRWIFNLFGKNDVILFSANACVVSLFTASDRWHFGRALMCWPVFVQGKETSQIFSV